MIDPNPVARPAVTVSPVGYESQEDGSFIYTDFSLDTSAGREEANQHHAATYEEHFVEDADTGERHFDNTADSNDYSTIVDSVGGMEVYQSMLAWARNNLSAEDVEEYNRCMEEGDVNDTFNYVQQLAELYNNQTDADNPEEFDEVSEYVFNNVIDREDYENLKERIRENYDAETIDQINMVMDSGNVEMIRNTIRQLQSQIYEY